MRPITKQSCVTSISTVPPVLAPQQECHISFPPTELFGGEQWIRCSPAGMKWMRIGCNAWCLKFSRWPVRGLSMLCNCGGVWYWNKIHRCTGVFTRGHQLCYCTGICSRPCPCSCPYPFNQLLRRGCPPPSPPLTVTPHPLWDLFDLTSIQKRRLTPFPVAASQDFVSSHYPVKNPATMWRARRGTSTAAFENITVLLVTVIVPMLLVLHY